MTDWNPDKYLGYAEERARPALDLIARLAIRRPRLVYDVGCGPGNSTSLLKQAFPSARIIGMDRSPAMIAKARESFAALEFISADAAMWPGDKEADLVFSNAMFHWLPNHIGHMERIVQNLKREGVFAAQMPDNLGEPSHEAMRDVASQGAWAAQLSRAADVRAIIHPPTDYYNALKPLCASVEIWHTAYYHALEGVDGIVQMLESTGLKPFLDSLRDDEKPEFLARYRVKLSENYPAAHDGRVLLRFPRIFILARK